MKLLLSKTSNQFEVTSSNRVVQAVTAVLSKVEDRVSKNLTAQPSVMSIAVRMSINALLDSSMYNKIFGLLSIDISLAASMLVGTHRWN